MKNTILVRIISAMIIAAALAAPGGPRAARAATGPLCYVNVNASGFNTGNSWLDAFTSLTTALLDSNCTEIWVAAGVYKPGAARTDPFTVLPGKGIYGGFAGWETDRSQRNWETHVTILSGDIDNNDTNTDGNHIDETWVDIQGSNSYHVVLVNGVGATPVTSTTWLDGFTITGGDAQYSGGGLFCEGNGAVHECSPTLQHLVFSGNRAANGDGGAIHNYAEGGGVSSPELGWVVFRGNLAQFGGAMNNKAGMGRSSPTIVNAVFENNSATYNGGAIFNDAGGGGTSSPSIVNSTFSGNSATWSGGAIINNAYDGVSSPTLANVTFEGNSAGDLGGAIYSDTSTGTSVPILKNVTFHGNEADYGGALYNRVWAVGGTANPTLRNVILWGDSATTAGNEIYNNSASVVLMRSVIQGGCGSVAGADCSSGDNPSTDPMLGPLTDNGGFGETLSLISGSSAINAGDSTVCVGAPVYGIDQRHIGRPQGEYCDIGALERIPFGRRADFESDGVSDIGYFRPSTGVWGILESSDLFNYSDAKYYSWGQSGDVLAAGDYDGDGRLDPTVRRPPAGGQSAAYRMLLSSTGYNYGSAITVPAGWPGLGDTPVPGDYNGDGISDPAIWRGNTGVWIIPLSPDFTFYRFFSWGASGDTPVGADVDGDGQTDVGYWRPSTGVWGFLQSSQFYNYSSPLFVSWGVSGDIPVMADYEGDGKSDPAVVIPPAGGQSRAYRIILSSLSYNTSNSVTIPAGWPALNDTPVPADYDGDGNADAGIWRGNTGVWIIPKSSTNNTSYIFAAWGTSGDVPAR
jgi:predicted outer membrane repeat protein